MPCTTWASTMVNYPMPHLKLLYWTWDMQLRYVSFPWPCQVPTQQAMQTPHRPAKASSSRICRGLCLPAGCAHWMVMRNWRCSMPEQSGPGQGRWDNPTKINTPGGSRTALSRVRWWWHNSGKEGVTDSSLAKENSELAGSMSSR